MKAVVCSRFGAAVPAIRKLAAALCVEGIRQCILIEEWRDAEKSGVGMSVTVYKSARRRWHPDSLVHNASVVAIDRQMVGDSMVMTGKFIQNRMDRNCIGWHGRWPIIASAFLRHFPTRSGVNESHNETHQ